jgi:hypothetical protein
MSQTNDNDKTNNKTDDKTDEDIILNQLYSASNELLLVLNKLKRVKKDVESAVKNLDNNYFIEKSDAFDNFNEIFNDHGTNDLISVINKFCEDVQDEIETKCSEHEFIDDLADTGYDNWVSICYCKNCHLSKKV